MLVKHVDGMHVLVQHSLNTSVRWSGKCACLGLHQCVNMHGIQHEIPPSSERQSQWLLQAWARVEALQAATLGTEEEFEDAVIRPYKICAYDDLAKVLGNMRSLKVSTCLKFSLNGLLAICLIYSSFHLSLHSLDLSGMHAYYGRRKTVTGEQHQSSKAQLTDGPDLKLTEMYLDMHISTLQQLSSLQAWLFLLTPHMVPITSCLGLYGTSYSPVHAWLINEA